jgi:putative hemolysin
VSWASSAAPTATISGPTPVGGVAERRLDDGSSRGGAGKHIVDALIEERAPTLFGNPATRWAMRHLLQPLLHYKEAVRAADMIAPLSGPEIMGLAVRELQIDVGTLGLYRLPARGRVVVAPNHPTGLADGVAVYEALRRVRDDLWFLANSDAIRWARGLADIIIPVEWVKSRRRQQGARRLLADVGEAFRNEAAVVIFPSGRISYMTWRGLRERPWLATAVTLARKFEAPILPLHIRARNSALFYALSQVSAELRDVTIFNELLNKHGRRFELTFGDLIDPADLPGDAGEAVALLQHHVEHELPRASRLPPALPRRRKLAARA